MNTEDQKQATPLSDEMLKDIADGWDDGSGTYVYTTTCHIHAHHQAFRRCAYVRGPERFARPHPSYPSRSSFPKTGDECARMQTKAR